MGAYLAACSSDGGTRGDEGNAGRTTGNGGKSSGAGGSDFGNSSGGKTGGSGGNGVFVPPLVDPSAETFVRDDTSASGLDTGVVDMLKNGSGACTLNVTYPYEGTIFPGALEPPIVMWEGAADAAYVHFAYAQSDKVDYQFAIGASTPGELQIPRDAWNEITRRTNRANLNVTLKVLTGGMVTSCELHFRVAAGNLTGAIYYNTYQAPADLGGVTDQGAVMRLHLGGIAEIYKQYEGPLNAIPPEGPCYSCHSVSFNGKTLVASYHDYFSKEFHVEKYDVTQEAQPASRGLLDNATFGALTPDGSRILAMGNPQCTAGSDSFPRRPNNFPLVEGKSTARMLDTSTGEDTQAQGLDANFYMWMPQFSPDGDKVVFNHGKVDPANAERSDRRELAVMDYDYATNTFSNLRVILSAASLPGVPAPSLDYSPGPSLAGPVPCGIDMCGDDSGAACDPDTPPIPGIPGDVAALPSGSCTGPCYPAWPFFTPDGKAVVFSLVSEPDFTNAFPGRDQPSLSELWYMDLETREVVRLANANKGRFPADELANYYPTVMPVALGGYFWVFWTSVRDYGHKVIGRGTEDTLPVAAVEAIKKRIWVAAIRAKSVADDEVTEVPGPLTDPSAPGFYLAGQSESGNVRAFAALNPCLNDGESCMSGLDCCCGYCDVADDAASGTCSCTPRMCSKLNEKCEKDSDCCVAEGPDEDTPSCLGGFCGFVVVD